MLNELQSVSPKKLLITAVFTVVVSFFIFADPPHLMPRSVSAATVTTIKPVVAPTTTTTLVPQAIMKQWNKVAWCESHGNWHQVYWGSHSFSGALGMRNDVWLEYGGAEFGPTAGHATPEEQVVVARRVQARAGVPNYVPDQGTCNGSW